MAVIRFKRGTLAQLDAAATAEQLVAGEPYFVTDAPIVAVGETATTYRVVGGSATLDGLADVDTATNPPVDMAVLAYDATEELWTPHILDGVAPGGGGAAQVDGGTPSSLYGGTTPLNGGTP